MNKRLPTLIVLLILFLFAGRAAANGSAIVEVDYFESYASDLDLQATWLPPAPESTYTSPPLLLSSGGADGGQGMILTTTIVDPSLEQPAAVVPDGGTVTEILLGGVDLSAYSTLTVWVKAGPDVYFFDSLNVGLGVGYPATITHVGTRNNLDTLSGWTRWDIDITSVVPRNNISVLRFNLDASREPAAVPAAPSVAPIEHVVYVDHITFNNGAVWKTDSIGGATAPWSTFANWLSGPPAAGSSALIPAAAAAGTWPSLTANAAVANLTVAPGANLFLNTFNLTVSGLLDNGGTIQQTKTVVPDTVTNFINTGGYGGLMILEQTCCLNGSASRSVCSQPAATACASPLGAQVAGATTVSITGAVCPGAPAGIERCFEITPTAVPVEGLVINFYFSPADLNGLSCTDVNVYHYNSGSAIWEPAGSVIGRNCVTPPYYVQVSGVSDFSPFAIADTQPTAVRLHSFSAAPATPWSWLRALLP